MWSIVIAGVIIGGGIGLYNSLVKLRERADAAWADIDIQLKRRTDLVPNIIATVKRYASHEKYTLEAVISARSSAMSAQGPSERA
jgi:LemA protein